MGRPSNLEKMSAQEIEEAVSTLEETEHVTDVCIGVFLQMAKVSNLEDRVKEKLGKLKSSGLEDHWQYNRYEKIRSKLSAEHARLEEKYQDEWYESIKRVNPPIYNELKRILNLESELGISPEDRRILEEMKKRYHLVPVWKNEAEWIRERLFIYSLKKLKEIRPTMDHGYLAENIANNALEKIITAKTPYDAVQKSYPKNKYLKTVAENAVIDYFRVKSSKTLPTQSTNFNGQDIGTFVLSENDAEKREEKRLEELAKHGNVYSISPRGKKKLLGTPTELDKRKKSRKKKRTKAKKRKKSQFNL